MESDADLMGRYCDGDEAAFYELYDRLAPPLLDYLIGLARQRAHAEDLLQTAFLKLHTNRSSYVRGAEPRPWMYAIAHRAFIDDYRRRQTSKRYRQRARPPESERAHITGVAEADAPGDGADPELVSRAVAALSMLPAPQREALELTKLAGMSVEQAARAAGTTRGAIKQRVHRGYKKLRVALGAPE